MSRFFLFLLLIVLLMPAAAEAQQFYYQNSPQVAVLSQPATPVYARPATQPAATPAAPSLAIDPYAPDEPDLLSLGGGDVDFDKNNEPYTRQADFMAEYRWGYSLASSHNSWLDFEIHPLAGAMTSTLHALYGFGGLDFDLLFWKHVVLTESEAVGLFDSGDAKPMGSFIEIRSMIEAGWRFDDDIRITAQGSHTSNGGLTHRNPGEESFGGYIHIPIRMFFGQ
jgi:hypothetical protein